MSRRALLRSLVLALVSLAMSAASLQAAPAGASRPNVLVIFTDQWRSQALSCVGDPNVRTPHLDRLAAQGVNFLRCYATNPVCSPAKAAVQTGRYPHQTGVIANGIYLPETTDSLAHTFARAGYETAYIGKWHLDGQAKPGFVKPGRRQGYKVFEGFNRGHWYYAGRNNQGARYFSDDGKLIRPEKFESIYQTDLAIDTVRRWKKKPFLIFLSYGTPHSPYRPPERFDRLRPKDLKWRKNVDESWSRDPQKARALCGYYGLIEMLDHEVGRLLAALEENGVAENTIILFSSDHGDGHGSHGIAHKGEPHEESAGIPLILRGPGVKRGLVTRTLASQIDFAPTLLSLCGLTVPKSMVGRDLSKALRGEELGVPWVYLEGRMQRMPRVRRNRPGSTGPRGRDGEPGIPGAWRALVTPRHKLVVDVSGEGKLLFALEADPYEMKNLARDPAHAKLRDELLARLKKVGKETGDPFPASLPRGTR
ncbi:MAG: sulfatase [Planctomycetota bacterium]|nr:sulfatase [Planctomycetota bacterium]